MNLINMTILSKPKQNDDHSAAGVSLCIARVFPNITEKRVKRVFIGLNWGFIERVDMVPLGDYQRAFVHFAPGRWNFHNKQAREVLAALKENEEIKVYYEADSSKPWYWKVALSRSKKPAQARQPRAPTRVKIGTGPIRSSGGEARPKAVPQRSPKRAAAVSPPSTATPRPLPSPPPSDPPTVDNDGTAAAEPRSWANVAGLAPRLRSPRKKLRIVKRKVKA